MGRQNWYQAAQQKAEGFWATLPPKSEYNEFVTNCTGYNVFNSKNCQDCIEVIGAQDSRYLLMIWGGPITDCHDLSRWGVNISESYEGCIVGENASRLLFCQECGMNTVDIQYSKLSTGGSHHFGCVSVNKGEYVVFNKKYSKEEYDDLTMRIRKQMEDMPYTDSGGRIYRYGEFFPPMISPFAYNESFAMNFFPKTQVEVTAAGYSWREVQAGEYRATKKAEELPDHIKDALDEIVSETIAWAKCPRAFRIVPQELQMLRRMNVPLPRDCPFCRINEKLNIWVAETKRAKRICSKCGIGFESPYSEAEAKEVLCRVCYQKEFG